MSSRWDQSLYGPEALIDGNLGTMCLTQAEANAWASVRVPAGTSIGYVAVQNRDDTYAYLLGSFELWLGTSYGHMGQLCGGPTASTPGPNLMWCRGVSHLPYVTVRQVGSARYLTIAELEVYRHA